MIKKLISNVVNTFGFKTDRQLVLICSDDWGSIRVRDFATRERLKSVGINMDANRFDRFDTLESSRDLEMLFDVLTRHADHNGKHPVFTALVNVANPDFSKIRESGFEKYFWQPFTETAKQYPRCQGVFDLYKKGIVSGLFKPQFHGREHLQISPWLEALRKRDVKTSKAFDLDFFFLGKEDVTLPTLAGEYAEAFNFWQKTEMTLHQDAIVSGITLFRDLFQYQPVFFTAPALIYHTELNDILSQSGISLIDVGRLPLEPRGRGKMRKRLSYLGQRNRLGQTYVNRNAVFEPNLEGYGVDRCLAQIEAAFSVHKPAIISNHRAGFVGGISEGNRDNGLMQLDQLLKSILKKWPMVEFIDAFDLKKLMDEAGDK